MKKTVAVRLAACVLAASLAGSPLPGWADTPPAPGQEKPVDKSAPPQPAGSSMSLEKAIAAAKEKVTVPADLDMFSSDYQEYDGRGRWMLRWHGSKPPESNMYVAVNAATGELESMNYYRGAVPGTHYKGLPAFSRDQCLEIARREGARLLPEKFSGTVLSPREEWYPPLYFGERDYPVTYDFQFKRTSGGIPVTDQGISIGVNAENGEVTRFDCSWSETGLPSPEGRIGPDRARDIFLNKMGFELTYFMPRRGDPDAPGNLKLAYRPRLPGRFILNALTGEVVDPSTTDFLIDDGGGGMGAGGEMMSSKAREAKPLTPAENLAVKETRDLIGSDRAQDLARQLADVPRDYTITGRNLERSYAVPGSRVWNVNFTAPDQKKSIWVSLDARSGELISFRRDERFEPADYYKEPQVTNSQEKAGQIAWELVRKLQPAKSGQAALRQSEPEIGPWVKMGGTVPRGYMFYYARMVNGVVFPENGFRVRVSSITGEILSYEMIWWETAFPKTDGVIGEAAANEKYLAEHPLTLEYGRGHKRWATGKEPPAYYLIYRPSGRSTQILDAATGREIDYSGNPVEKKGKQPFTDISGHPAEADIVLLAGEGIVSGEGGSFRPDDPATAAEVLAMLVKAYSSRGPYYPVGKGKEDPWYKPVVESALTKGILDKDFNLDPGAGLNRLQLAYLGINAGGWGKLARLPQIFRLETADAGSIPEEYRGYVAAALGMELLPLEDGKFNPGEGVTRAQAASFLVKLLKR